MKQLFIKEGFGNLHSIKLHEKFGFVRFPTLAEAQLFVDHFNGFHTGNTQLKVELSQKRIPNHPPGRRLHISGYDPLSLNERDLYWAAAPHGFIRHISFRPDFSFIDFDTVEDAIQANEALNGQTLKGKILTAQFARTLPAPQGSNLSISLADVVPRDHEIWTQLAEKFSVL
jgi:RNA recognition motif-containing protein